MSKLREQLNEIFDRYDVFMDTVHGETFNGIMWSDLHKVLDEIEQAINQSEPINKEEWVKELSEQAYKFLDNLTVEEYFAEDFEILAAKFAIQVNSNLIAENEDLKNRLKFLAEQMSAK